MFTPVEGAVEASLTAKASQHPRLYFSAAGFEALQAALDDDTMYQTLATKAATNAATLLAKPLPAYVAGQEDEPRAIGEVIAALAFQYQITDEIQYYNKAYEWAMMACNDYPIWGVANNDLAAGHILYGLGLFYDWCYDRIPPADRATIRNTIVTRGTVLATCYKTWKTSHLQNHNWINLCGLTAAALAVYDEAPAVKSWIPTITDGFAVTFALLPDDGASHEGVGYWTYGVDWLLRYADLSKDFFGVDGYQSDFLINTAMYRIYMGLPQGTWYKGHSASYDYSDANRQDYSSASAVLQRLAGEYGDIRVQYYADELVAANLQDADSYAWRNLMNYDSSVDRADIRYLSKLNLFKDLGLVTARSNWSGSESLIGFKNGPALGLFAHEVIRNNTSVTNYTGDMGHVHPDNNSFILFANGEMLLREDGYVKKYTDSHNTLLVDGGGQAGEGYDWFNSNGGTPVDAEVLANDAAITKTFHTGLYDYWVADAAKAYKTSAGVKKFKRHILYLKQDDVLIAVDDVDMTAQKPLELRFFPEGQIQSKTGNIITANGTYGTRFDIELLTPSGVGFTTGSVSVSGRGSDHNLTKNAVRITKTTDNWLNATAFKWAASGGTPASVGFSQTGNVLSFTVGGITYNLDVEENSVTHN